MLIESQRATYFLPYLLQLHIRSHNVYDFDLDLLNVPRLNLNMLIEGRNQISYLKAIVLLAVSLAILDIIRVEMCMTLTLTLEETHQI